MREEGGGEEWRDGEIRDGYNERESLMTKRGRREEERREEERGRER